ncbi:hypothetical protein OROHE_009215 [Orobanche hederae]
MEQAANLMAAATEDKAARATEELAAKVVELDGVTRALAGLKGEIEVAKLDPYSNVEQTCKFAYYLAYADVIRVAKGSGIEVGPIVEAFKYYVPQHPLNTSSSCRYSTSLWSTGRSQLVSTARSSCRSGCPDEVCSGGVGPCRWGSGCRSSGRPNLSFLFFS